MSSIYGRMGFDGSNPIADIAVKPLDDSVMKQMKMMPPFLNTWQTKDVAEANTGGYFQNPVATTIINVNATANTMRHMANSNPLVGTTGTITTLLANTKNTAILISYSNTALSISSECNNFTYITNRLSNMVSMGTDTTTPHYQLAIGYGKMMSYIAYQSDGVQNNSPIMGCFTSLYTANTLNSLVANTTPLLTTLTNSLTGNNSSISLTDAQSLDSNMAQIYSTMYRCRTSDTSFYQNCAAVFADYTAATQFNGAGQSENQLIQEVIGSPKLLERLNANT
jgi:hypothetical protein